MSCPAPMSRPMSFRAPWCVSSSGLACPCGGRARVSEHPGRVPASNASSAVLRTQPPVSMPHRNRSVYPLSLQQFAARRGQRRVDALVQRHRVRVRQPRRDFGHDLRARPLVQVPPPDQPLVRGVRVVGEPREDHRLARVLPAGHKSAMGATTCSEPGGDEPAPHVDHDQHGRNSLTASRPPSAHRWPGR
jgi:hypothetical protein